MNKFKKLKEYGDLHQLTTKKVKDLTVEELINLGKADNVRQLRIVIDGSNDKNKHWEVNIGGVEYGRWLFLEDEIEVI